jgi:hypothetical protein
VPLLSADVAGVLDVSPPHAASSRQRKATAEAVRIGRVIVA